MGTSSAQRSPTTPEWERVRDLYRAGVRDPDEIARRIVRALEPAVREDMSGPGVATCLDVLLHGVYTVSQTPPRGPLQHCPSGLAAAGLLRGLAERHIAVARRGSRFSDLALDALGSCVVNMLAPEGPGASLDALRTQRPAWPLLLGERGGLGGITRAFVAQDLDRCFRYFVGRDISEFIGTPPLPDVAAGQAVADEVAAHCRAATEGLCLTQAPSFWAQMVGDPREQAREGALRGVLSGALEAGLDVISSD